MAIKQEPRDGAVLLASAGSQSQGGRVRSKVKPSTLREGRGGGGA
jgi:hypothetical protein